LDRLHDYLLLHAGDGLLPWSVQIDAAERFGLTPGQVEEAALRRNLLPLRYKRNQRTISTEQQLRLFQSCAAIVGCGGLGGYVVEELARLGLGRIVVIDPDIFEEHNLNRQLFSSVGTLGKPKVEAAAERVAEINPAVTVVPLRKSFSRGSGGELLEGVDIVADALDSIPTRLELAEICNDLRIPLVHGSIAGWYGQVISQFPGENTLQRIYDGSREKGIETELGNPSFTPAVVASIEAAEVCKILLGEGSPLRSKMLAIDLLDMEIIEVKL
jgi:molybdopterin/thiamine biosynthesis adenylyltransferase